MRFSFAYRSKYFFAFCRALSQERLSDKAMDDIRTKLGLKRGTVGALSPRDMRPLTAAQVRAILDKYAGEINANRASRNNAERVRTSSEIHRRLSAQDIKDNRAMCARISSKATSSRLSSR